MKTFAALLGLASLISAAYAVPASHLQHFDPECSAYLKGERECYTHTVTVADGHCPYTLCPSIINQCRAEWLMTFTVVEVPCNTHCCPTTATKTVTTPCATCPETCSPVYTQTNYRYPFTCTTDAKATGPAGGKMIFAVDGNIPQEILYVHHGNVIGPAPTVAAPARRETQTVRLDHREPIHEAAAPSTRRVGLKNTLWLAA